MVNCWMVMGAGRDRWGQMQRSSDVEPEVVLLDRAHRTAPSPPTKCPSAWGQTAEKKLACNNCKKC